jgi:hypothetical protein
MRNRKWVRLLAYVTGSVNQELLLQNEYLAAENRILRSKLPSRLRLSTPERITLAEIGKRLGRKVLGEVACIAKPDTILAWYRKLVARKFDCGYRKFHILGAESCCAGKARRVALTQESNPGLADRWKVQISTGLHSGIFTQRSDGELYRLGSFQAARRS